MAHVKPGREPEFSVSGSGDDLSVFWNPDSSAADSFAPLPKPTTLPDFSSPPSSPSPDTSRTCVSRTNVLCSMSPASANEKKRPRMSRTRYEGAALEQLARVVSEQNPYAAKHNHKAQAWKDVHEALKKKGYFLNTSFAVV